MQSQLVGAQGLLVLPPLKVEVSPLPLLDAKAEALGGRQAGWIGAIAHLQQSHLIQQCGLLRDVRLPGEERPSADTTVSARQLQQLASCPPAPSSPSYLPKPP